MKNENQLKKAIALCFVAGMMLALPSLLKISLALLAQGDEMLLLMEHINGTLGTISGLAYITGVGFAMKAAIAFKGYADDESLVETTDNQADIITEKPQKQVISDWRTALRQQKGMLNKLAYKDATRHHNTISDILLQHASFWEDEKNDTKARFIFKQTALVYLPETFALLSKLSDQSKTGTETEQEVNTQLLAMKIILQKTVEEQITAPALKNLRSQSRFLSQKVESEGALLSEKTEETILDEVNQQFLDTKNMVQKKVEETVANVTIHGLDAKKT